jgi:diguanylate cyclase (GGDEF)-like protein
MSPLPRFLQAPEAIPRQLPEERDGTLIGWIDLGLSRLQKETIERIAVVLVLALGLLQYALPPGYAFVLFYMAPITAASWYAGRSGYFLACIAAAVWTVATWLGTPPPRLVTPVAWSAIVYLVVFMAVAVLTDRLRTAVNLQRLAQLQEPLTGLANSSAFRQELAEEIERALRYGGIFTVAYMDLDDFKEVNDSLGHAEGDKVIQRVAQVLQESTRTTDTAARMGGDEFALLLPETPYAQAEGALRKLRNRVNEAIDEGGWNTAISIGAVTFEAPVNSADEALRLADRLMYEAKADGGDGIHHILWTGESAGPG